MTSWRSSSSRFCLLRRANRGLRPGCHALSPCRRAALPSCLHCRGSLTLKLRRKDSRVRPALQGSFANMQEASVCRAADAPERPASPRRHDRPAAKTPPIRRCCARLELGEEATRTSASAPPGRTCREGRVGRDEAHDLRRIAALGREPFEQRVRVRRRSERTSGPISPSSPRPSKTTMPRAPFTCDEVGEPVDELVATANVPAWSRL